MIKNSSILSDERNVDVFTGIDIWSRGCLGGFDTFKSLGKKIFCK